MLLNPDVFAWPSLGGSEEQRKYDEELVENAAAFLLEAVIPNMVRNFNEFSWIEINNRSMNLHHL